jgi:phosphatidylglycerophosphate synthase
MFTFIAWCILFVLCWPLALMALLFFPLIWLIALPFRLIGISVDAVFALLKGILFLPARVLGYRPR